METPPRFSTEPDSASASIGADATGATDDAAQAVTSAVGHLKEAQAYAAQYVTAKLDGLKATARTIALYAVLGVVAAIVGLTAMVTATVLLMTGITGALAALFGEDLRWLANLLVGLLLVGGVMGGIYLLISRLGKTARAQTMRKYEAMHRRQHMDFGHTAAERAHQPEQTYG